jgi:hypothetical protein
MSIRERGKKRKAASVIFKRPEKRFKYTTADCGLAEIREDMRRKQTSQSTWTMEL